MYVDTAEIRSKVVHATGEGWNCTGVCYGVPDFNEQVIENVPRSAPLAGFGQGTQSGPPSGEFPVGPVVVIFGLILGGFVLSLLVEKSPAGRWRWSK